METVVRCWLDQFTIVDAMVNCVDKDPRESSTARALS